MHYSLYRQITTKSNTGMGKRVHRTDPKEANKHYGDAMQCHRGALQSKHHVRDDFAALHYLGFMTRKPLVGKPDYQLSLSYLDRALEIEPNSVQTLVNRSLVYKELHMYEAALRDLDKVIAIHNVLTETYYIKATILYKLGRYEEARQSLINSDSNAKIYSMSKSNPYTKDQSQALLKKIQSHLNQPGEYARSPYRFFGILSQKESVMRESED